MYTCVTHMLNEDFAYGFALTLKSCDFVQAAVLAYIDKTLCVLVECQCSTSDTTLKILDI